MLEEFQHRSSLQQKHYEGSKASWEDHGPKCEVWPSNMGSLFICAQLFMELIYGLP